MNKRPRPSLLGTTDGEAPAEDTGVPQRGEEVAVRPTPPGAQKPERRIELVGIKMKPSVRDRLKALTAKHGVTNADVVEEGIRLYEERYGG